MANALDRVKAAEAKYAALVGTAEKLEATLKKFTGTADTVLCGHALRVAKGDQVPGRGGPEGPALGFLVVCVDGRERGRGRRHLWEFFTGGCGANPRCSGGLVGKLILSATCWSCLGGVREWAERIGRKHERGNDCYCGCGRRARGGDPHECSWVAPGHASAVWRACAAKWASCANAWRMRSASCASAWRSWKGCWKDCARPSPCGPAPDRSFNQVESAIGLW